MNSTVTYGAPSAMPACRTQAPTVSHLLAWPIQPIMGHQSAQLEQASGPQGNTDGFTGKGAANVKAFVADVRGVPPRGRPI